MSSSPFSDPHGTVRLRVTAGSPLAEVFLIDHAFALVDRSIGDLDTSVTQGVYKVKARVGDATTERLVVLNSNETIDLSSDLPVATPAPLAGTSRTHESHMYPTEATSAIVATTVGSGAQVLLVARRWSSETRAGAPSPPSRPPELSLHGLDGRVIVDLGRDAAAPADWDPVAGMTVELDPGGYLLRWCDNSSVTAEQTIYAVRDWQTQVFLLEDAANPDAAGHHRVSVLMARDGFRPDDSTLRSVEDARAALAEERKVASKDINEALFAKFENPMLGLFGAHLMLLAQDAVVQAEEEDSHRTETESKHVRAPVEFDQDLFDGVIANLRQLLGRDHPDVTALATKASDRPELEPVKIPPMLWRSWVLLIEASNDQPALVPVSTWRRALKLLPMRPFLAWSPEGDLDEAFDEWQQAVASTLGNSERTAQADLAPGGAPASEDDEARRRLTLQLLAPRAAIDGLAADAPA